MGDEVEVPQGTSRSTLPAGTLTIHLAHIPDEAMYYIYEVVIHKRPTNVQMLALTNFSPTYNPFASSLLAPSG